MTAVANVFAYPEPVWTRFRSLSLAGELTGADLIGARVGTPAARSVLALTIDPATPPRARFRGYGCPYTLAVGQWLAEQIERDGLAALTRIDAHTLRQALEIPEERAHCALMGEDLVRALQSVSEGRS